MQDEPNKPLATVNIRPGVSVLSVLRHLNYKPWFALAEFVDNAVQSYIANREKLESISGPNFKLIVNINIDTSSSPRITIKDNAAGISYSDFPRAFRPAAVPPDRSGLSEFGMGMKSASCWFSPRWQVRTKAIGEKVGRIVQFDIEKIVNDQIEELAIQEVSANANSHFTEITLENLYNLPVKKTVSKIKEHLTDIYRVFLRQGVLELKFGEEALQYQEPSILIAPYERDLAAGQKQWRKEINFDLGNGQSVIGFAALRDPGNFARAGFSLFRRNRVIEGSGDDGYRPPFIFGQPGSFRSLRLFGELHLEGFEISHTKDGFRWDENEQPFLELLKEHLDSPELPLLKQADLYRSLAAKADRAKAAQQAVNRTVQTMEDNLPEALPDIASRPPVNTPTDPLNTQVTLASKELRIEFRGQKWLIKIALTDDPSEGDWLSMSDQQPSLDGYQIIELRVSLAHPFMIRFAQTQVDDVEAMLRTAAALGLAEVLARQAGVKYAGTVRRNVNAILLEALSQA